MTMPYANPRRCIEQALPPRLLYRWLTTCVTEQRKAFLRGETAEDVPQSDRDMLAKLNEAWMQPLQPLAPQDRERAIKRLDQLQADLLAPYASSVLVKVFLAVAYLWRDLLEDGHCTLIEGSAADHAYQAILAEVLNQAEDVAVGADRSAEKAARRMRQWLEGQGYYNGRAVR